jgi:acyl-coenzyme A synthetase/AMP-(fatty) acid ligase
LKYCILTAEASLLANVSKWMDCMPGGKVVNLYGPTEATIWCTGYELDVQAPKAYNGMLAIGKPFKHVEAFILDELGNETALDIKGELCIASDQLTKGYLNNQEKTGLSFIEWGGKRLYKTGDLCYKDISGDIFYCGRIDHQVKIQGFRIELNEIEAVAKELISVNNAAVVYKNKLGVDQICLFLEKYTGEAAGLKKQLEQKLPYYMIPTQVRVIEELPHNTSSKIDRVNLSKIAAENEH